MDWRDEPTVSMGVSERPFHVTHNGEKIPGILWMPEAAAEPVPLVLMGHGGKSEKRNPVALSVARRFVRRNGLAACAIDAIDHGERGPIMESDPPHPAYIEMWKRPDTFDRSNGDWVATLDAVLATGMFDPTRIGYWGLSMGTMLGLPLVASEPRIKAAVLGACGFTGPSAIRGHIAERHRRDAQKVTCPVMFLAQWDDEVFHRDGVFEMFGALASTDKQMRVHPGPHGAVPLATIDATREFLAARL